MEKPSAGFQTFSGTTKDPYAATPHYAHG